jgi:hypothetical protein
LEPIGTTDDNDSLDDDDDVPLTSADLFSGGIDDIIDARYRWSIEEITSITKEYGATNNHVVYNANPPFIDITFCDGSSFQLNIWFVRSAVVLSPTYEADRGEWAESHEFSSKLEGRVLDVEALAKMAATYGAKPTWLYTSEVAAELIFSDGSLARFGVEADEFRQETVASKALGLHWDNRLEREHQIYGGRSAWPQRRKLDASQPSNRSHNALGGTLAKLIKCHGNALIHDRTRCQGLLTDYHPQQRSEIKLLINAHAEGIPEILAASASELSLIVPRLIRQLEEQLFLTQEAATWTIETWTLALYPRWLAK